MALPVNPIKRDSVCLQPVCLIGHFKDLCNNRVWLLVLVRALQPDRIPSIRQREVEGEVSEQKASGGDAWPEPFKEHRDSLGSF